MPKGIKRLLDKAYKNVSNQIKMDTDQSSLYSKGLSGEGYDGGYRDALQDVLLALNGVLPNRNGWWEENKRKNDRNLLKRT